MGSYPEIIHRIHDVCVSLRSIFPVRRYPLKNEDRYSPFFIVGSGRSGNTLLRKLLVNHPMISIPPETYVLGGVIKRFRQQRMMRWNDLVEYIFSTFEFNLEFNTFEISLRPLVQQLKIIPEEKRNLAFILHSFYMFYATQKGVNCKKWGDKTPLNTFVLERLYSVFPDAKFIHIVRDGCDVVPSYVNSGIYSEFEDAARRWTVSVEMVKKFQRKHSESVFTIRYEDLVTTSQVVLRSVCDFIGIDFDIQMLEMSQVNETKLGDVEALAHHVNVLKPISTSSIGKGRSSLTPNQKEKIKPIIDFQLKQMGYEKC